MSAAPVDSVEELWGELWISFASLLRSYTAVHGMNGNSQAVIESSEDRIVARRGEKWLTLQRQGATVNWKRDNGDMGTLTLTEAGRLRGSDTTQAGEEEMDMAAEAWARELMR